MHILTSLEAARLEPDAWRTLLRRRWAVENENHKLCDRILRPFILAPQDNARDPAPAAAGVQHTDFVPE